MIWIRPKSTRCKNGILHQIIKKNTIGRDFVVGDIHGCYDQLMNALSYEGFNRSNDRLFSVGDIIDRGPDSEKCLKLLQEPWFHMVRGNHEEMLINACGGGGESYNWRASFGSWAKRIDPEEMSAWGKRLQALPIAITIETDKYLVGICHAEPDGQDWNKMVENPKSINVMLWGRRVLSKRPKYDVEGVDITIHGHTPIDRPVWVGNRYFMDTGAGHGQDLTVRKINDIHSEYAQRQLL